MKMTPRKWNAVVILGIGILITVIGFDSVLGTLGLIIGIVGIYRFVTEKKPHMADVQDAIWNPNAAGNWSVPFSMVFGSYLLMQNWRTLGDSDKASTVQNWFHFGIVLIVVYLGLILIRAAPVVLNAFLVLFSIIFIVWYFTVVRPQSKYVKERFGDTYSRRPWGKVLLIGAACLAGFLLTARLVGPKCGQYLVTNPFTNQFEYRQDCR